jgi:hypothetical protein
MLLDIYKIEYMMLLNYLSHQYFDIPEAGSQIHQDELPGAFHGLHHQQLPTEQKTRIKINKYIFLCRNWIIR